MDFSHILAFLLGALFCFCVLWLVVFTMGRRDR